MATFLHCFSSKKRPSKRKKCTRKLAWDESFTNSVPFLELPTPSVSGGGDIFGSIFNSGSSESSSLSDSKEQITISTTYASSPPACRRTTLAVKLISSTPPSCCRFDMLRKQEKLNGNGICMDGNVYGSWRNSPCSTITTPVSSANGLPKGDLQQQNGQNGHNGNQQTPTRNGSAFFDYNEKLNGGPGGTLKGSKLKAFRTASSGGSIAKHLRMHKLPQPHRCDVVFEALERALKECVLVTQQDIDALRCQLDTLAWPCGVEEQLVDTQKQFQAAERYLKRLTFHVARAAELRDLYSLQLAAITGSGNDIDSKFHQQLRQQHQRAFSATTSFKGALKEATQILTKFEAELEMLIGTLNVQVKGIAGFARLTTGDVFELQLKCGSQKWKSKVKIGPDKKQIWEAETVVFKCLLDDILEIKVFEHKTFGKSNLMIEKTFDPVELFSAQPQLITVDLNRSGSLKLRLLSTWNPLDGLLTPLTTVTNSSSTASPKLKKKPNSIINGSELSLKRQLRRPVTVYDSAPENGLLDKETPKTATLFRAPSFTNGNGVSNNNMSSFKEPAKPKTYVVATPPRIEEVHQPPVAIFAPKTTSTPTYADSSPALKRSDGDSISLMLRRLRPALQKASQQFSVLLPLEDIVSILDAFLAKMTDQQRLRRPERLAVSDLDHFDSCLRLEHDPDNLDDNVLNRSISNGFGHYPSPAKTNGAFARTSLEHKQQSSSPSSSSSSASYLNNRGTPNRPRRYLKKGEATNGQRSSVENGQQQASFNGQFYHSEGNVSNGCAVKAATLERKKTNGYRENNGDVDDRPFPCATSFGEVDLDICIYHHLLHCELLLQKLVCFGPLHHCEQESLCKLVVETSILSHLAQLVQSVPSTGLPKVTQLLSDLDVGAQLQDVWLSASGTGTGSYYLPSNILRLELRRTYGYVVQTKYPHLLDNVFDKLLHLLTDRSSWEPDLITVYQFVYCFHDQQLNVFIESMAHETWIVDTINCRVRSKIERVMDRLKHVPVPPPPDVLRHIGLILVHECTELQPLAESYLLHAQGVLRDDLVTTYLAFLEHEDSETRRGACRALTVLNARRSIKSLVFVSCNDRKASVREEARKAVLSFGAEGGEALSRASQQQNGANGHHHHATPRQTIPIQSNGLRL